MPVGLDVLSLLALGHALIAGIGKDIRLLAVNQAVGLCDIVDIGRCAHHRVNQTRVGIDTDVRLHTEMPLIALLGLVHLGVALAAAVLGRTGRGNQRGVHDGAALEQQPLGLQGGIDRGQDRLGQLVLFEKVAKPQDRALIGKSAAAEIESCELLKQRHVVERFFHGRVRQIEPLLQEVNTQHRFHRKRRPASLGCRRVRCNQCHQLGPRHDQFHLVEELALARPLARALEAGTGKAHLFHVPTVSRQPVTTLTFAEVT